MMRHAHTFLACLSLGGLLSACSLAGSPPAAPTQAAPTQAIPTATAPPAAPQPTTSLPPSGAAPGQPLAEDTWTPGDKQAFGTAFTYDRPAGDANPSRVWFALTNGAITEGLYPDVSQANVKSIGAIVTDRQGHADDEMADATYKVERLDKRAPAFRVTSTDKRGRWAIVKQVVADPQTNTILFTVSFEALQGRPEDYRLFMNYVPRVAQSGASDLGAVGGGFAEAWDAAASVYTALTSDPAPALLTVGYTGASDLPSMLKKGKIDTIYTSTAQPGRISIGMELPVRGATTLALGFGTSHASARAAAAGSLKRGFASAAQEFERGWAAYLDGLSHPYPLLPLYDESLAVVKSLEDKTHYGAFVASPAIPWGQFVTDADPRQRGDRYVWPRDLYHMAMALKVAGDERAARDALAFLDERMQRADGGIPRRALPDGTADSADFQLDQVALPIVLAWHLKAVDRYASLVKPAADFILANGPRAEPGHGEEIAGYLPGTLAAEIAGLVCAADLAERAGDAAGAARYRQTADAWNASVEKWTLTTSGPLGKGTYYLRASAGDPNAAETIDMPNGGGTFDQRALIDWSALDLVRFGLRQPNDPRITATLDLAEDQLKLQTPKGELYYRFPHDGYGESKSGIAPDGHGNLWPLLVAAHSIYEVAQTRAEHPASWYLPVVSDMGNAGGMLPQQVFPDGSGTGAATPHGWTHAEYIMFAHALKQERVPDTPAVVAERYLK